MAAEVQPTLLSVRDLKTYFYQDEGMVKAVDGVSFDLYPGGTLGIVGESGCGKSVTARSILGIVDRPGRIVDGEIRFRRQTVARERDGDPVVDLAKLPPNGPEIRAIRGAEIALIFQEPMSSFSPVHTIGSQIDRGDHAPPASRPAPGAREDDRDASAGRRVLAGAAGRPALQPAERRPAPAGHDRDGAVLPSDPADRGRAHDGARRDHADRRFSSSCASCSAKTGWRSCSSPTTWGWSPRWPPTWR